MAIDTELELLENQENLDTKIKILKKQIKTNNKKIYSKLKKRMNKQHQEVL